MRRPEKYKWQVFCTAGQEKSYRAKFQPEYDEPVGIGTVIVDLNEALLAGFDIHTPAVYSFVDVHRAEIHQIRIEKPPVEITFRRI